MNKKILICGNKSFVAKGLEKLLEEGGFDVECFSRGEKARDGNHIYGDVFDMKNNHNLSYKYDVVINFIVLKDKGIEDNILYLKQLIEFCADRKIEQLIHFSSIMVYDNCEAEINEQTPIEEHTYKAGYGEIKVYSDKYLSSLVNLPFSITLIRLGYVLADDRAVPFIKPLGSRLALIKGGKKSIMPIVKRSSIHEALANMLRLWQFKSVYLFVPSSNLTKLAYAKECYNLKYIVLNKTVLLGISKMLVKIHILPKSFYVRIEGMFIESNYNSTMTEKELNVKF